MITLSSSAADAAIGLGLDLDYHKFQQSISSSVTLLAITISPNVKLDNVGVLKSCDGYKLWPQKLSVMFEARGLYEIVVMGIDLSPLASTAVLITFELAL
jgi:hypothetical protein